jgi:hypothetical protein
MRSNTKYAPGMRLILQNRDAAYRNGSALENHVRSAHPKSGESTTCPACKELREKMGIDEEPEKEI